MKKTLRNILIGAGFSLGIALATPQYAVSQTESINPIPIEELQKIKDAVKEKGVTHSMRINALSDSVSVYEKENLKISSGKYFTSFRKTSDKGIIFLYDILNDGIADCLILTDGPVNEFDEANIDLDGCTSLNADLYSKKTGLNLEQISKEHFGETPYNTRTVFYVDSKNEKVTAFDYKRNEISQGDLEQINKGVQDFYKLSIKTAKKSLNLD